MNALVLPIFRSFLGFVVGLAAAMLLVVLSGENALSVTKVLFLSSFGSRYDLGVMLYYATPLIFTGLSVSIAFRAGLFNIGAEGQLTIAALVLGVAGASLHSFFPAAVSSSASLLFSMLGLVLSFAFAILAGAIWGFIPGWLKAYRGSHEVIVTIMLNFIAAGLSNWIVTSYFQNPGSQSPETRPVPDFMFFRAQDPVAGFFGDSPVSSLFFLAIFLAIALQWVFKKTRLGYEIGAVGQNSEASAYAGINVKRMQALAMTIAGGLAAMVAVAEISFHSQRFKIGFSPDFGFLGIAVALLARTNPIGVIFTALLFAILHKGSSNLDIETEHITRDFSLLIQALILLGTMMVSHGKTLARKK